MAIPPTSKVSDARTNYEEFHRVFYKPKSWLMYWNGVLPFGYHPNDERFSPKAAILVDEEPDWGDDGDKDATEGNLRQSSNPSHASPTSADPYDEHPLHGSLPERLEQIARNLNKVIQQHHDLTSEQPQEQ